MSARTLVLLRHAKAQPPGDGPDLGRMLADRGHRDADAAGAWLADEGLRPDLVLCSPAMRTRQTWQGVSLALAQASAVPVAPEVHYDPHLYDGGRTEVVDLLRAVAPDVRVVLVVGHNPTVSDVSLLLDPDQDEVSGLRTAGLAVHRGSAPWAQTEPGAMALVSRHTARA